MEKITKKALAVVVTLAMLLSMLPATVFAASSSAQNLAYGKSVTLLDPGFDSVSTPVDTTILTDGAVDAYCYGGNGKYSHAYKVDLGEVVDGINEVVVSFVKNGNHGEPTQYDVLTSADNVNWKIVAEVKGENVDAVTTRTINFADQSAQYVMVRGYSPEESAVAMFISEIEVYANPDVDIEEVTYENLALGATVNAYTADGILLEKSFAETDEGIGSYLLSNATDGNETTSAVPGKLGNYMGDIQSGWYAVVTLDEAVVMDRVRLSFYPILVPSHYTLEVSEDGAQWKQVGGRRAGGYSYGVNSPVEVYDFVPTLVKYIRVVDHTQSNYMRPAEIQAFNISGATESVENLAYGKSVELFDAGFDALIAPAGIEALTDGAINHSYYGGNGKYNHAYKVDLGEVVENVNQVVVSFVMDGVHGEPDKYDIFTSEDGVNWTLAADVQGENVDSITTRVVNFPGTSAQYVMVRGYYPASGRAMYISEIEVYSNPDVSIEAEETFENLALGAQVNGYAPDGTLLEKSFIENEDGTGLYLFSHATDGNMMTTSVGGTNGSHMSAIPSGWYPVVTLDEAVVIDRIGLQFYPSLVPPSYSIDVSEDGASWVTVAGQNLNTDYSGSLAKVNYDFKPTAVKYIRIKDNTQANFMRIAEIEAYNVSGKDVVENYALGKPVTVFAPDFDARDGASAGIEKVTDGVKNDYYYAGIGFYVHAYRIDLEEVKNINEVEVTFLSDGTHGTPEKYDILVSTDGVNVKRVADATGDVSLPVSTSTINFADVDAQYVYVRGYYPTNRAMYLAEVGVYSNPDVNIEADGLTNLALGAQVNGFTKDDEFIHKSFAENDDGTGLYLFSHITDGNAISAAVAGTNGSHTSAIPSGWYPVVTFEEATTIDRISVEFSPVQIPPKYSIEVSYDGDVWEQVGGQDVSGDYATNPAVATYDFDAKLVKYIRVKDYNSLNFIRINEVEAYNVSGVALLPDAPTPDIAISSDTIELDGWNVVLWNKDVADTVKIDVTDKDGGVSTITIDGQEYISGTDYKLTGHGEFPVVVTTKKDGHADVVSEFVLNVPMSGATKEDGEDGATIVFLDTSVEGEYIEGTTPTCIPSGSSIQANAIDNDYNTIACAAGSWSWQLHMDLGEVKNVDKVKVYFGSLDASPTKCMVPRFSISYSENGVDWTVAENVNLGTITEETSKSYEVKFDDIVEMRYLRIRDVSTGYAESNLMQMTIGEVEINAYTLAGATIVNSPKSMQVIQRDAEDKAIVHLDMTNTLATAMTYSVAVADTEDTVASGDFAQDGISFIADATLPAGMYDITVTATVGGAPVITLIEDVGIGDVFLTYGQSNSCNWGDYAITGTKTGKVFAYDPLQEVWKLSQDPQPNYTGFGGGGGSAWPTMGDYIVNRTGYPVGLISCGYGGAYVEELGPDDTTGPQGEDVSPYEYLKAQIDYLKAHGGFKAILFHQGEGNVSLNTPPATYAQELKAIIDATREDAGFNVPWMIAAVGAVTVGSNGHAVGDNVIKGTDMLINAEDAIYRGPYTDDMECWSIYRPYGIHFGSEGIKIHGTRWAQDICEQIFGLAEDSVKLNLESKTIEVGQDGISFSVETTTQNGEPNENEIEIITYPAGILEVVDGKLVVVDKTYRATKEVRVYAQTVSDNMTYVEGYDLSNKILSDVAFVTVEGLDVAYGKSAEGSSYYEDPYTTYKVDTLFDNNTATRWVPVDENAWVIVDLEEVTDITEISLGLYIHDEGAGYQLRHLPVSFTIQVSDTGEDGSWTTIVDKYQMPATRSEYTGDNNVITINDLSASGKFVKLVCEEGQQGDGICFTDMHVYTTLADEPEEPEEIGSDVYTIADGFIRNISVGTTIGAFLENVTPTGSVKVYKTATTPNPLGNSVTLGTGMIVKLLDADNEVIDTLTVVIVGDLSGDGKITTADLTLLNGNLNNSRSLSDAQTQAANLAQPTRLQINTQDLTFLKGALAGTRTITQR